MLSILFATLGLFSLALSAPLAKRDFLSSETVDGDFGGWVHDPSVIRRDYDGTYFMVSLMRTWHCTLYSRLMLIE